MKRIFLYISVPTLIAVVAAMVYLSGGRMITTDNAYVRTGILTGAARISGEVRTVLVERNQHVNAGDVIAELDDADAQVKLLEAQAGIVSARNLVAAVRANHRQSLAAIAKEEEVLAFEQRELARAEALAKDQNISEASLDNHRHKVMESERQLTVLREAANMALTQLGGNPDLETDQHPMVLKAKAAVKSAEVLLDHHKVRTRTGGTITQIDLHPGEYVAAGYPIFGLTVDDDLRIEANPKETDLTFVKVGQPVDVLIDALPGQHLTGKVASIDPATGAEFAVLPAQNATGNWVKVTQRIPVQIQLDEGQDVGSLRAGLSAEVSIDTGHERTFDDLLTLLGL